MSSRPLLYVCLCAIVTLALAAPATTLAAVGGSGAFSELTEGQSETTPTQTTTTAATTESTSKSGSVLVIAGGAAVLLLGGIAILIMRDARNVAPAGDGLLGKGGSGHDTAAMMRKRRAKAKAARRQRKQNVKRGR